MLEILNSFDTQLFIFLNVTLANPVFDVVMPFITNKYTWIPVWIASIIWLFVKGGWQGKWIVLLLILTASATDFSGNKIKKSIKRIRPCNVVEEVHLTVKKKSSFSLPSNHAANFFALATMFSLFFRKHKWWFYSIAFLVAFSRIAIGVHYPFDLLAGAALGVLISLIWYTLYQKYLFPKLNQKYQTAEK